MPTIIRTAKQKDRSQIFNILDATPEFKPEEVLVAEEVVDSYLQRPGGDYHMMVAVDGSIVEGYICYGPTPLTEGTWDIYWLAVHSGKQGRGIGARLVEYAEEHIKKASGRLILIETSSLPMYEKTRRFYYKRSYEEVCRIPDFYAVGDDKVILKKVLQ